MIPIFSLSIMAIKDRFSFKVQKRGHIPKSLELREEYGAEIDARGFLISDPAVKDKTYFERYLAECYKKLPKSNLIGKVYLIKRDPGYANCVLNLIRALGRPPTTIEVQRELFRRRIFDQIAMDSGMHVKSTVAQYSGAETIPQQGVIRARKEDFPAPENALQAWTKGKSSIEKKVVRWLPFKLVTRLIISIPNREGKIINHPVMTDEEIEWVKDSAAMIASIAQNGRVFIAGFGLGLLNIELNKRGVKNQVVAEL